MNKRGFVVFALALALALAATAARAVSEEPKGGEQDATYAKELEIRDLLLEKGGQSAVGIRVTVDRTKAILTGDVPTRAAQELAEEVALSVDGIKSVNNRLQIKPPAGGTASETAEDEMADALLESKVKKSLYNEIGKRARQVEVEAVDGVVSLRGKLPDDARKKIALDAAGKTKGVVRVIDLIKVES